MAILSVDLAFRRWSDLGIVVLDRAAGPNPAAELRGLSVAGEGIDDRSAGRIFEIADEPVAVRTDGPIVCEIIQSKEPEDETGPVDANVLAGRLNHLCTVRDIRVIMLDGPQAWKSGLNGLEHSRVSERQLNTASKTGLPGMVKPVTYRAFAEFCLDVYDALCRRGWRRLDTKGEPDSLQEEVPPERILVESYPHAAWKSLGLKPLPSKKKCKVSDLAEAYGALRSLIPMTTSRPPNHDQLQAIVGGLPGLALAERNSAGARIVGNPPHREGGHWREGFIVLPLPPAPAVNLAWLNSMRWLE